MSLLQAEKGLGDSRDAEKVFGNATMRPMLGEVR